MAEDACERCSMESMDFISSLPDLILHHILSFVPTYLAIKTCVLSRRWRHIWREVPSISLECDEESIDFVTKTLFNHTACKLLSFHLGFRFDASWLEFPCGNTCLHDFFIVDTWIDFAIAYEPENLSLDFVLYHYQRYTLPDIFYVNPSVKRLSLVLHGFTTLTLRSTVFWPSLKTLCLDGCNIPDESAAKILSGCPVLESLTLNFCMMLGRLDLSGSMNLRRLEIDNCKPNPGPMEIVAPHIHYLILKTSMKTPCILDDVSSLTEAKLDLTSFSEAKMGDFLHVMSLKILPKLHNIEKLTLGSDFLQVLSVAELRGVPFPMLKITALSLEMEIFRYFVPENAELRAVHGIIKVLENSPGLKNLTLNLKKRRPKKTTYIEMYMDSGVYAVIPTSSEPKLVVLFIELVLGNAKTLESLVVQLEDNLVSEKFEELLQMAQTLSQDHSNVSIEIKHKVFDF